MRKAGADRQEEILEAAARIFRLKGYRSATLNDISAELNLTRAALYYYFGSKQALLVAIVENAGRHMTEQLDKVLALDESPRCKLAGIMSEHTRTLLADIDMFSVFLAEQKALPTSVRKQLEEAEQGWVDRLTALIQEGIDSGDFQPHPPKVTAVLLLGMPNWATRWYREGAGLGLQEVSELIGELAAGAVSVQPPA